MLDDLPSFPTQSIPPREILSHAILGGSSPSSLVETGPPVVVVVWIVVDVEVVDSAEVGIVGDAIVGLGLVAQLCRHCLNAWTSSKACSSRCV